MRKPCGICGLTGINLTRLTIDEKVVYVCGACKHEHELEVAP